jgi:hypothetical protein
MHHDIDKITTFFNKFLLTSKYGRINSVAFRRKEVEGEKTPIDCISFSVDKKQSSENLKSSRIKKIPSKIYFDGVEYQTDIIEGGNELLGCSDCHLPTRTPGSVNHICGFENWTCGTAGTVFPPDTRSVVNNYRRLSRPIRGGTGVHCRGSGSGVWAEYRGIGFQLQVHN